MDGGIFIFGWTIRLINYDFFLKMQYNGFWSTCWKHIAMLNAKSCWKKKMWFNGDLKNRLL